MSNVEWQGDGASQMPFFLFKTRDGNSCPLILTMCRSGMVCGTTVADCPSCCVYIVKWAIVVVLADLHFYVPHHVLLFLGVMTCGFVDGELASVCCVFKRSLCKIGVGAVVGECWSV